MKDDIKFISKMTYLDYSKYKSQAENIYDEQKLDEQK
jgi:hypothetical protein